MYKWICNWWSNGSNFQLQKKYIILIHTRENQIRDLTELAKLDYFYILYIEIKLRVFYLFIYQFSALEKEKTEPQNNRRYNFLFVTISFYLFFRKNIRLIVKPQYIRKFNVAPIENQRTDEHIKLNPEDTYKSQVLTKITFYIKIHNKCIY